MIIVVSIVSFLVGFGLSLFFTAFKVTCYVAKKKDKKINKFLSYYRFMVQWMESYTTFGGTKWKLGKNEIIAVYGAGKIGELCTELLLKNDYNVACIIDANKKGKFHEKSIIGSNEYKKEITSIIVTPFLEYDEIRLKLENSGYDCKIVSIEKLI